MYKVKNLRSLTLSRCTEHELRIYYYNTYKTKIGSIYRNIFFINTEQILNYHFQGFNFKTVKSTKNLKTLRMNLMLAFLVFKALNLGVKFKIKRFLFMKKKIYLNLNKMNKHFELKQIHKSMFFFSKRWQ